MSKKLQMNDDGMTQKIFASVVQATDGSQVMYATAFLDVVNQINGSLAQVGGLANELRARAQQMHDLAELVDATLTAAPKESAAEETAEATAETTAGESPAPEPEQ